MSDTANRIFAGGCLCGQLRYEAKGEPAWTGHCYCRDCRKASGSGFIPFMGFQASALTVTGETRQSRTSAFRGGESVRNHCAACGSLVFGGEGQDDWRTVYAGSLDDALLFEPQIAIFVRDRAPWAVAPEGLTQFETMPD
ncbi:GFA family protein [Phenylobacterium deserti]|uniref:Aldehyde-activating protein n=1 Tax=Phenylobacterium deserti TaxID=1914756 RepID=A0A328ATA0_9CAUL|nr:GFA family protein [Phenylobacterium deserti]RAK57779.1 aldehyde-activating protein [Phenylobacterium deserti]